jgi:hypothetical protein
MKSKPDPSISEGLGTGKFKGWSTRLRQDSDSQITAFRGMVPAVPEITVGQPYTQSLPHAFLNDAIIWIEPLDLGSTSSTPMLNALSLI